MTNNESFFALDLKSLRWSVLPLNGAQNDETNVPPALDEHSAAVNDGKMYIFGGFNNGERDNRTFVFNFGKSEWIQVANPDEE
jgi:hypothetical protein